MSFYTMKYVDDALMDKFRDGWELNELNRKDKNNESTLRKTIGN